MKYKAGDKVRIKTWEDMEKEFGLNIDKNINSYLYYVFTQEMEEEINRLNINRILTIESCKSCTYNPKIHNPKIQSYNYYYMKEIGCKWTDGMIECLAEEYKIDPINSRWEILDL